MKGSESFLGDKDLWGLEGWLKDKVIYVPHPEKGKGDVRGGEGMCGVCGGGGVLADSRGRKLRNSGGGVEWKGDTGGIESFTARTGREEDEGMKCNDGSKMGWVERRLRRRVFCPTVGYVCMQTYPKRRARLGGGGWKEVGSGSGRKKGGGWEGRG